MADPFSIVGLAETGVHVAKQVTILVKDLDDAPDQLLALSNELWNLVFVLDGFRELQSETTTSNGSNHPTLPTLLYQARVNLGRLNEMVSRWGRLSNYGDSWQSGKRARFLWLKERKSVIQVHLELRELRESMVALVGTKISCLSFHPIRNNLLTVHRSKVSRLGVDAQKIYEECLHLADGTPLPEEAERFSPELAGLGQAQIENKELFRSLAQVLSKTEGSYSHRDNQSADQELAKISPSNTLNQTKKIEDFTRYSIKSRPIAIEMGSGSATRLCPSDCQCHCHSKSVFSTPSILQQVTGRLFLGYSGKIAVQSTCVESCRRRDGDTFKMTFFFPKWFLQRAVLISLVNTCFGATNLNIKICRVVPEMSKLFPMSRYGYVEGLKQLFIDGLASPDDVHIRGGWTSLHFAVDHGNVDACRFLLANGADPTCEDNTGTTPAEIAWRNILQLRAPPNISDNLSVLFPGHDFLQDRGFTRLHRVVIGLTTGDVSKEVQSRPSTLHACDVDGWTALHWAARRGNHTALETLLAEGANPNATTGNEGRSALHLAAQGNSVSCIRALLKYRCGNVTVDIEARDCYGNTALRLAASYNCAAATAILLQYGANVNTKDDHLEPPLFSAVYENAHETITQLLRAGCDYTLKTKYDNNILHFAANESDAETVTLLLKARLRGVDVHARNADGLTALDLAASRVAGATPDWKKLFERLLDSVEDLDYDARSIVTMMSGGESWKSFEDMTWYEADFAASQDVRDSGGEEWHADVP